MFDSHAVSLNFECKQESNMACAIFHGSTGFRAPADGMLDKLSATGPWMQSPLNQSRSRLMEINLILVISASFVFGICIMQKD